MVLPLAWKDGEGYDIHLLRGPVKSKSLLTALELDTSPNALKPKFTPNFTAASSVLGVTVDDKTGQVTATPQPSGQPNKFPSFNFLIKAHQAVGGVATYETEIRVHIHNSVKAMWLTPSSLTPHVSSDECRFTVLARFDDDTIGDITDWPATQLKLKSAPTTVVSVLPRGVLHAKVPGKTATITATLTINSPPTNKTATAQVFTKPTWIQVGRNATLEFVAGPVQPNPTDLDSSSADSVKSVIAARTNVLFVAEGFLASQAQDFRQKVIDVIVNTQLQTQDYLEPFKLLAKSINYWSVFVESQEDGTSVLGDQTVAPAASKAKAISLPRLPAPTASQWNEANLIHEGGLPLPNDLPVADPDAWVANRNAIFTLPSGVPNTPTIAQKDVGAWNGLRPRLLLNERNTAFGLAHSDRPKVSDEKFSPDRLLLDSRRMSGGSLGDFLGSLNFGKTANSQVLGVGKTWDRSSTDGKDAGLVCLVCRSDLRGGMFSPSGRGASVDYFTVSTGDRDDVDVKVAGDGREIVPPPSMAISAPLVASLVAYGCGRAFGLGDEQGDGEGNVPSPSATVLGLDVNLQNESQIVTTAGPSTIDVTKIAWLWPRIAKAALVKVEVDSTGNVMTPQNCDQNGTPNPSGAFLLVRLVTAPTTPFAAADPVRLRGVMVRPSSDLSWRSPSIDEIADFPLKIESVGSGTLVLSRQVPQAPQIGYRNQNPGPSTQLQPAMFKTVELCAVIAPRLILGAESKLVSKRMLDQITSSNSPLNAPSQSQGQSCTPAPNATADVVATNLPSAFKAPARLPSRADLVGIYDGGGHFDCGVFRPAGRCRMRRRATATTPFCQVCCYVIVDRVDPSLHGLLDDQYDPRYPN